MTNRKYRFLLGVSDFASSEPLINAEKIVANGMDFIEPGLAKAAAMPQKEFEAAAARLKSNGIVVATMNWFLPPTLKVTGPDANETASREFLESALSRAALLGAKAVVFGSPGSRSVPEGFSFDTAQQQMIDFCHLCSGVIRANGWDLKIAVEHINHTETNFINTFAQALDLVREVDRPEIGLAADFYHFAMESEPTDIILDSSDLICAVQLANPDGRCFPKPGDDIPGMETFFRHLIESGYTGGVSVEANSGNNLETDCHGAVEYLEELVSSI